MIYGPYTRKDGRKHVIHYDQETKERFTQSYPRYLMENHLGRKLEDWEEVDHIDEDFTNDSLENLQLLTKEQNIDKSRKAAEIYIFFCPNCKNLTQKPANKVRHNRKQGKSGPFCSKSCARKYALVAK